MFLTTSTTPAPRSPTTVYEKACQWRKQLHCRQLKTCSMAERPWSRARFSYSPIENVGFASMAFGRRFLRVLVPHVPSSIERRVLGSSVAGGEARHVHPSIWLSSAARVASDSAASAVEHCNMRYTRRRISRPVDRRCHSGSQLSESLLLSEPWTPRPDWKCGYQSLSSSKILKFRYGNVDFAVASPPFVYRCISSPISTRPTPSRQASWRPRSSPPARHGHLPASRRACVETRCPI